MINITHSLRVRYGETDPMKYVYYGNYAEYLEVARVELFRAIGISYNEIEKRGIWLPVSEYKIKYIRPAKYDDLLYIHTNTRFSILKEKSSLKPPPFCFSSMRRHKNHPMP